MPKQKRRIYTHGGNVVRLARGGTPLARTRGTSRFLTHLYTKKRQAQDLSFFGAEGNIIRCAHSVVAQDKSRSIVFLRCCAPRANPRYFAVSHPPIHQKKTGARAVLFLAQKAGFEPALRFSHTTPLAGEPLEPLGYFCMAQNFLYLKSYITIAYFFCLVKAFCLKKRKMFFIFYVLCVDDLKNNLEKIVLKSCII